MLYRSDDGGRHWRSLCDPDHSPSKANIHGLIPDPQHAGGVLIGTDTGEAWRVSNDAEWELLARGPAAGARSRGGSLSAGEATVSVCTTW